MAVLPPLLLFEKSYERVKDELRRRVSDVNAILWNTDGSLKRDGVVIDPAEVSPTAVWASGDMLATWTLKTFSATLAALPSVRWLQTAHAGTDHPIYVELAARGVRVSKSSAQSIPIAEYVLGYALAHVQDFALRRTAQADGRWKAHRFGELWHKAWLIIGYRHIGKHVARRAKAFDCHTVIVRQSTSGDEFADQIVSLAGVKDHLPSADFVVLACPATEQTRGLVDSAFLNAMNSDALLINVARGSLIDEASLITALDQGALAGAVLDVFAMEPLPDDDPLWRHSKVTVTAHTSNAGSGTRGRGDELFISKLERFVAGAEPLDLVPIEERGLRQPSQSCGAG